MNGTPSTTEVYPVGTTTLTWLFTGIWITSGLCCEVVESETWAAHDALPDNGVGFWIVTLTTVVLITNKTILNFYSSFQCNYDYLCTYISIIFIKVYSNSHCHFIWVR